MKRIAVFPGSFDPITIGHESIILRARNLFDEIHVSIGSNSEKSNLFSLEQRCKWIKQVFQDYPDIKVSSYTGLTVDYCKSLGAGYLLRGLRTSADFEFERSIGQVNKKLYPEIETVYFLTTPEHTFIKSSVVRDIIQHGGNADQFVPDKLKGIRISK